MEHCVSGSHLSSQVVIPILSNAPAGHQCKPQRDHRRADRHGLQGGQRFVEESTPLITATIGMAIEERAATWVGSSLTRANQAAVPSAIGTAPV